MYYSCMERKIIKEKLLNHYVDSAANSILRGIRKPSYKVILTLYKEHNIPFEAWQDIKSFINSTQNDTQCNTPESNAHKTKKAS